MRQTPHQPAGSRAQGVAGVRALFIQSLEESRSGLREMGFQEPKILVELTRQLRKEIRRDRIAKVTGLLYGGAQRIRVVRHVVHKKLQHRSAFRSRQISFFQSGLGRRFAHGTIGHATERSRSFSD